MTGRIKNDHSIKRVRNFCRKTPHAFASDHKLLEAACLLFELRQSAASEAITFHRQVCSAFHKCLILSSDRLLIVHSCKQYKFNRAEIELLLLLMISEIGVYAKLGDLEDICSAMKKTGAHILSVARLLNSNGRLCRSGLIETEVGFRKIRYGISPEFISEVLGINTKKESPIKTHDDLLAYTETIFDAASERLSSIEFTTSGSGCRSESARKRVEKLLDRFLTVSAKHPAWPLSHAVHSSHLSRAEVLMVLMLLGIELGFSSTDDEGFKGHELAKCTSATQSETRKSLTLLRNDHRLRKDNLIQIRGNRDITIDETEDTTMLRDYQFELTDAFLHTLKIKRRCKKSVLARLPMIQPEQLVLSEHVAAAFDMCIA